jgi:uncharacterized damage-inducible protein DinB
MNMQELESRRVQALMVLFHQAAEHVPEEKAKWKPDPNAKSAQEIVEHLIQANHFFAALIRGDSAGEPPGSEAQSYHEALQALKESGKALSEAIASVPDSQLGEERTLPWGDKWKLTMLISAPSAHIAYHWGQIAYLQTMWGDKTDYHFTST